MYRHTQTYAKPLDPDHPYDPNYEGGNKISQNWRYAYYTTSTICLCILLLGAAANVNGY